MKSGKAIFTLFMILLCIMLSPSIKADENSSEGSDLTITEIIPIDSRPSVGKDVIIEFNIKNVGTNDTDYISLQITLYSESDTPLALLSNEFDIYGSINGSEIRIVDSYSNRSVGGNETVYLQIIWDTGQSIKSNGLSQGYNPSPGIYRISINVSGSDNDIEPPQSFSIQIREETDDDSKEFLTTQEIIVILGVLLCIAVFIGIYIRKKRRT